MHGSNFAAIRWIVRHVGIRCLNLAEAPDLCVPAKFGNSILQLCDIDPKKASLI
jgi:hypothetical protein